MRLTRPYPGCSSWPTNSLIHRCIHDAEIVYTVSDKEGKTARTANPVFCHVDTVLGLPNFSVCGHVQRSTSKVTLVMQYTKPLHGMRCSGWYGEHGSV